MRAPTTGATFRRAAWAAWLVQAVAAAALSLSFRPSLALATALAGALLLAALASLSVARRQGVTLLGAWSRWLLLVGATVQLVGATWALSEQFGWTSLAGGAGFHLVGTLAALPALAACVPLSRAPPHAALA